MSYPNDADIEMWEATTASNQRHAVSSTIGATDATIARVTGYLVEAIDSGYADSPSAWLTEWMGDWPEANLTSDQADAIHFAAWDQSEEGKRR